MSAKVAVPASNADRVVRDYIATLHDLDDVTDDIAIIPERGEPDERGLRK